MKWKPIKNYEGLYEINKSGQVRSLPRNSTKGKILKPVFDSRGYAQVNLSNGGKVKVFRIHVLVALVFLGLPPPGYEVNHKNGIKSDARLKNLEYVTRSLNMLHSCHVLKNKGGAFHGEKNKAAKLNDRKIKQIRLRSKEGERQSALAKEFGVCRDTIRKIVARIYWRHI